MESRKAPQTYSRKARAAPGRPCSPVPLSLRRSSLKAVSWSSEKHHAKRKRLKRIGKGLPKIIENCLLTEKENTPIHYSTKASGATENRSEPSEISRSVSQISLVHRTESACSSLENKTDMKHSETPSEMSVPTGVSSYLLDCLDTASLAETVESSSCSPFELSSPETMRGAVEFSGRSDLMYNRNTQFEYWLKCKNSTLLESSQAVDIDLLPQPSNISEIEDISPKLEFDDQAKRNEHEIDTCLPVHISTMVAGKTVCKMMPPKEETPASLKGASLCVPTKPVKKPAHCVKRRNSKCKRKVAFVHPLCSAFSSSALLEDELFNTSNKQIQLSERNSVKYQDILTSTPVTRKGDLVLDISPVRIPTLDEELVLNTTGPFVCSSEIVPESPSSTSKPHTLSTAELDLTSPVRMPKLTTGLVATRPFTCCDEVVSEFLSLKTSLHELNTVTRQAGYETRTQDIEDRRRAILRNQDMDERSREILQMIKAKKFKYCTLGLYSDDDDEPEPMPPVTWKPRPIPKGIPLDFLTL